MIGTIIGMLVIGVLAGFLARALLPGKQSMSFLMTVLLGVAGAVAGFYIFEGIFGWGDTDKFDLGGLPGSVIGAMILLFIYEKTIGGSDPAPAAGPVGERSDEDKAARREARRERREG